MTSPIEIISLPRKLSSSIWTLGEVSRVPLHIELLVDEAPNDDPNQPIGTDLKTFQAILNAVNKLSGNSQMIQMGGFVPWAFKYVNQVRNFIFNSETLEESSRSSN